MQVYSLPLNWKSKPIWKPKWWKPKPLWKGKACAWAAANGPEANSTITAAIAATLKATPVFEFINVRYAR